MKIVFLVSFFFIFYLYYSDSAYSSNLPDSVKKNNLIFEYSFPEFLPKQYSVDTKKLYLSLLPKNTRLLNNSLSQRYTEAIAFDKKYLMDNGYIYIGWEEMETYLNRILNKIMPDSLKGNPFIHIYPARITDANAFCMGDGTILFDIGLMASIKDEAGMAIILGHELSHYIHHDAIGVFLRNTQQHSFLHDMFGENGYTLKNLKYNREEEQKADSVGFVLANNAGYDITSGLSNFSVFSIQERMYHKYIQPDGNEQTKTEKYATHPLLSKRINNLNGFIKNNTAGGKNFLFDEKTFHQLQRCAIHECINLCLSRLEYESAMQISFIRLLSDPEDPAYLYYTGESIRRYIYLFKNKKDSPFLDYELKTIPDKNILKHLYFLYPDSAFIKQVSDNPVLKLNKNKGITYDQLYRYCYSSSINFYPESYLGAALYYRHDTLRSDSLLKVYLSYPQVIHKEYALAILNNNLHGVQHKQSLLLFGPYQYKERRMDGEFTDYFTSQQKYPVYLQLLQSMTGKYFPEKKIIALDSARITNPREHFMFLEAKETMEQLEYYHIQDADLCKLDNKYWYLCKKTGTQNLEFLSVTSWTNKRKIVESTAGYLVFPFIWFIKRISYTFTGPSKYHYEIDYKMLKINDRTEIYTDNAKVKYKLRPPYFINSIYHVFKKNT